MNNDESIQWDGRRGSWLKDCEIHEAWPDKNGVYRMHPMWCGPVNPTQAVICDALNAHLELVTCVARLEYRISKNTKWL